MTRPYEYTDTKDDETGIESRLSVNADAGGISVTNDIGVRSAMSLPTGPTLTEFLQAVADDTHVVIPVADLPKVAVDVTTAGSPTYSANRGTSWYNDRAFLESKVRDFVAILRAMDAHEAAQAKWISAQVDKVEELATRLRRTLPPGDWPGLEREEEWAQYFTRFAAREAIAWHEEQGGQG